jgi:hypothetical protein
MIAAYQALPMPVQFPGTLPPGRAAMATASEPAPLGDELRIPAVWCQLGSCISRFTDAAALGESDVRFRAVAAGWREDALGRLACPACVQQDPTFRISYAVTLWSPIPGLPETPQWAVPLPGDPLPDPETAWIDRPPARLRLAMTADGAGQRHGVFRRREAGRHRQKI